mmetsp:Transcript_21427/g.46546  ORF Transcript_21427/g.46546 Transcript_21427/m.46546 type:complete len:244 (-) Transcript_21427:150-881(-)
MKTSKPKSERPRRLYPNKGLSQADRWEEQYGTLCLYREIHEHCNVPHNDTENARLATWVNRQRTLYREGKLSDNCIERLEWIDFMWQIRSSSDEAWENRFNELVEYKAEFGDCNVPARYTDNPQLGKWVVAQRSKRSKLSQDRIDHLDDVGFRWSPKKENWEECYGKLIQYKAKHGHTNVPWDYKTCPQLGWWANNQRSSYKEGRLKQAHIDRLRKVGFCWKLRACQGFLTPGACETRCLCWI